MANKKSNKQTFTIEQLGCPVVSYKYEGDLKTHLISFGGAVCDLPTKYLGMDVDFDEFHECFKQRICEAIQDAMCEITGFDTILDIEPVMPKIDYYNTRQPQVAIDKWVFEFNSLEADPYGTARAISDLLPWDEIIIRINESMADNLKMNDGFCAWDAWDPEHTDEAGYDGRWVELYVSTEERNSPTAYDNGTATQYNTFRLDEIIRKAAAVKGRQWRNYCHCHELPVVHEAMDFMCWVLDHRYNFDDFIHEIGVVYDPYADCTRPDLDSNIFAVPDPVAPAPAAVAVAPTKEIKTNQSQTTDITDNNNPQTNTTTMEQTTTNTNTIPAGWKAQPSRMDMTTEEFTSIYFDRFFKEQIGKIRIDHTCTVLRLYNDPEATVKWQAKEDGGAQVALTVEYRGITFYFMYDMKNNGARDSRAGIDGKLYQFSGLAKMGECIPQFVGVTPPANVRDYLTADVSPVDEDSFNLNRKPKNSKQKSEKKPKSEAPQPQPAPTAKVRKEPIAQQTTPNSSLQTPNSSEAPKVEMPQKPASTDATFYFDGDGHYYHLYRDEDGVNGGVVILRKDGSVNSHIKHRDFAQLSAFIASKKMTKMEQLPDALMKALVKEGVVKALKVSEECGVRSEELSATPQQTAPTPKPQPKAEESKQTAPTPAPQETPTKEIKGNQAQPKKETPNSSLLTPNSDMAKVVPFTLPGEITISNIKTGSMTLNGLTDLTAEQISIFVAGMNAMREAIRKQMNTANA